MGSNAAEPRKVGVPAPPKIFLLLLPLINALIFFSNNSLLDFWKLLPCKVGDCSCGARARGGASTGTIGNGSGEEDDSLTSPLGKLLRGNDRRELDTTGFACKSDHLNDVCVSNQRVWMKIDVSALTVNLSSPSNKCQTLQPAQLQQQTPRKVRPYVKKNDDHARRYVKEITIQTLKQLQSYNYTTNTSTPFACDVTHDVPAVVFSTGLTGNVFHELNEIIIPLFLTCRHFRSQLRFVVTDFTHLWVHKFRRILSHLSDYQLINASEDTRIHCFPGVVIGLHFHNDNLVCKNSDLPVNCSMLDFRQFLRESFNLKIKNVAQLFDNSTDTNQEVQDQELKPVLVLLSRRQSRRFLNEDEMVRVASELGFRVIVADPDLTSNIEEFSGVVNRCSVLVGAHGAGLTNEVFMPEGAVVIQVVPLGLQWASTNYYGNPLREMGVHYLEYQISPQESKLLDVYGPKHPVITNPDSIYRRGYNAGKPIYIDGQDLRLNISKFKDTLVQALKLLGH